MASRANVLIAVVRMASLIPFRWQTHIDDGSVVRIRLCVEMFDLLIGEPRTTKRRMNFNEFDFRWNCERELYEKLKPVFDEMIAERNDISPPNLVAVVTD